MKLQRHEANPILLPDPGSDWECYNVFNPGVVYHNGLFRMWYRAQGMDWISRIGYAVSEDGVHWNRLRAPVLAPIDERESRGVEDPRVVWLDDRFVMTYTAYSHVFEGEGKPTHDGGGIAPMVAVSDNGIRWERLGPIVTGESNKDHVLFPRKINGRYAALHRRWPTIWIAYSDDLVHWPEADMSPIFGPRPENWWDSKSVGSNGVPVETESGWLLFYHGYNEKHVYRWGTGLLDLEDPTKIISRPESFIFEPEEIWELRGDVPQVVFSCANPVVNDKVYFYYGGADHVIGLAEADLAGLMEFTKLG